MPSIPAGQLQKGFILDHSGARWRVVSLQHVKPGKGGAFMQAELKNIKTGTKLNERFRTEEKVERLILESIEAQFSYRQDDLLFFLRLDSYEEVVLNLEDVGESLDFLIDDIKIKLEIIDEEVVGVKLPDNVKLKVVQTEPHIKGATATQVNKPAVLSNGITVLVPPFITEDEVIIVNTETREYLERA